MRQFAKMGKEFPWKNLKACRNFVADIELFSMQKFKKTVETDYTHVMGLWKNVVYGNIIIYID